MALAGRKNIIKVPGTAAAMTNEAMTDISASLGQAARTTWRVTNSARRVLERTGTFSVRVNAVVQSATLYTLHRLDGRVEFFSPAGAGAVDITGNYLPMTTAAEAKAFALSLEAGMVETPRFGDVWVPKLQGLKDVTGSFEQWRTLDQYMQDALWDGAGAGVPMVWEWTLDGANPHLRAWALLSTEDVEAAIDGAVEEPIEWEGTTDTEGRAVIVVV